MTEQRRFESIHPQPSEIQALPTVLATSRLVNSEIFSQSTSELLRGRRPDFENFPLGGPPIGGGSDLPGQAPEKRADFQMNPDELYSLEEVAEVVGYTTAYLRRLLGQGKIEGKKFGKDPRGVWATSIGAVRRYQNAGNRIGRPRNSSKS
jgi:hypothetical protein